MKKKISALLIPGLLTTQLTGCMGQMGLSAMVTKGNLSAVDNRYGRAGLFVLMSPIYGLAATADLFVVNSVEFWTGTNPVTGRSPAVVDMPVEAIFKVNQHLNGDLTKAPLPEIKLTQATIEAKDENTLLMTLSYEDHSTQQLLGKKVGDEVNFFFEDQFVATVSIKEMQQYSALKS